MRCSPADLLLVVGVDEEGERRAVGARRRLDDVRDVALLGLRVEVLELLAGERRVLREVEVAAVGDALELGPADREQVLDVGGAASSSATSSSGSCSRSCRWSARSPSSTYQSKRALLPRRRTTRARVVGRDEELHLHLLELARAEDEVARRDLVAKRLADLRDAERRLLARELQDVLEVDEDALRGLGAQVDGRARVLHGAHRRLEHEVEVARLGEVAVRSLAGVLGRLLGAGELADVVGAEALAALAAVDHRVGEAGEVPARLPRARVLEDRASRARRCRRAPASIARHHSFLTFVFSRTP